MSETFALVSSDNVVANIIAADPHFTVEGYVLVQSDNAAIGDTYDPYTGEFTSAALPEPEPIISIPSVTFWERTTETEGSAIEAMLNQQPFRVRQIFMTAQSYRSDHELWPLLQSAAIGLFGEERAAELLAQP